jgi:hypothetical protein
MMLSSTGPRCVVSTRTRQLGSSRSRNQRYNLLTGGGSRGNRRYSLRTQRWKGRAASARALVSSAPIACPVLRSRSSAHIAFQRSDCISRRALSAAPFSCENNVPRQQRRDGQHHERLHGRTPTRRTHIAGVRWTCIHRSAVRL